MQGSRREVQYAARLKLLAIHPNDEQFLCALSDVFLALSDAECLRLAARHNIKGHFHCELSHRDYVSIETIV